MQTVLRRVGSYAGPLLCAAALPLLLPPLRVTVTFEQGPARDWVFVYQFPETALGFALLVMGLLAGFSGPRSTRWITGGLPAVAVAVLAGVGFACNDYHAWWWQTAAFTVPLSLAAALAGGISLGRILGTRRAGTAVALWLAALVILLAAFVLSNRTGYFDYSGIVEAGGPSFFPGYSSYAGDYLVRWGAIFLYKIGIGGVLAGALAAGALRARSRPDGEGAPAAG